VDPDSEDVHFRTGKNLLYRVMANLTRNALEATASGGSVTLSCGATLAACPAGCTTQESCVNPSGCSSFTRFFPTKGSERLLCAPACRGVSWRSAPGPLPDGSL